MAMLVGRQTTAVSWQTPNEPGAVRRLLRKLEREAPGPEFYHLGALPAMIGLFTRTGR